MAELDAFTGAYITAALWSSSAEMGTCDKCGAQRIVANQHDRHEGCGGRIDGQDLSMQDRGFGVSDIEPETLAKIVEDCAKFQAAHSELFTEENCRYRGCPVEEYAGHDFWLTRNGHGAGFWDGDWLEPAATALDKASKAFGEFDLYIGDDGRIYS